jgi:hypothetical protein
MSVFAKHGITHLSASSLSLYRDQPAAWCAKYLCNAKDEVGPGAWRGTAVEAGLDQFLFGAPKDASIAMSLEFEVRAVGVADDAVHKERLALQDFLNQAQNATRDMGTPLTKQSKISIDLPGIEVPIIGYVDYRWADRGLDLKTTWRMPSTPSLTHVEQMAIYNKATGIPFSLLYVTPKKYSIHEVTSSMADEAMERVLSGAQAIRHMLSKVDNAADALRLYSPDYDHYRWSPSLIEAAKGAIK